MDAHPDQMIDHLRTGVMLLSGDLTVDFINPATEQILGRSLEQTIGLPVQQLLAGNGKMLATLSRAAHEAQGFTARQISVLRADMSEELVDCSATPLAQGLLLELQSLDTQMRMLRDDQSARQQETTRELTKGLAHEVKNPLGGIRGATQLLAMELDDPKLREYTDVILSEVDRLRDLVDRMLGPRVAPQFATTNVHEVLERALNLCAAEFGTDIEYVRDYDPSLPPLEADRDRLFQACFNVIRNAAQALEKTEQPKLSVCTRIARQLTISGNRFRSTLKIDIEDNGPGIDDALKDRLFYPMISGRADGTGLGLAMAQTIIGEHHGALEFVSRPGRTVFTLFLPLTQPQHSPETA